MRPASRWLCLLLVLLTGVLSSCARDRSYPNRPITVICPWAAGGGTDQIARQVAAHLERDLQVPVSVVNAVGGKGVTGHARGLHSPPDGYTLLLATVELNMLHWNGLTDLTWKDGLPLMSVNEDYAAVFVRKDSPWQTLDDLESAVRNKPGSLHASGTAAGAIWHVALAGWLQSAGLAADDVVWISETGSGPSLQQLLSGGVDMVCCSLPEAAPTLAGGKGDIRCLGVMAPQRVADYPDVPTFVEQGHDWTLGGWRGVMASKELPADIAERLTVALRNVVTGETKIISRTRDSGTSTQSFPEFMDAAGFDHTYREREQFAALLEESDEKFGELLTSPELVSVNRDRYHRWVYPGILIGLLAVLAGWMLISEVISRQRSRIADQESTSQSDKPRATTVALSRFGAIIGAVAAYCLFADSVGFVVMTLVLLFLLLRILGTRSLVSAAVCVVFVPVIWELFGRVLRVPLPFGWWGG